MHRSIIREERCFGSAPDRFREKLDLYHLFRKIHLLVNGGERCHVIVVGAWKAITEEQFLELNEFGIAAIAIGESQKIDDEILEGKWRLCLWYKSIARSFIESTVTYRACAA